MKSVLTAVAATIALSGAAIAQSNTGELVAGANQLSNIQMNAVALLSDNGVTADQVGALTVGDLIQVHLILANEDFNDSAKEFHIRNIFAARGMR